MFFRSRLNPSVRTLSTFLGSASFMALSAGRAAAADAVAPAAVATPVEEVLITGSLIRGAPAVGVPVTAVGAEQFQETGSLTTAELLRSVPTIEVDASVTPLLGGGRISGGQNISIHGFEGSGGDPKTLLLINGKRWPIQGHGGDTIDPSIVPQLAVQRVDVLTAGASAVYGADAVSGVVNVVMRRNFDGAISQLQFGGSPEIGGIRIQGSQLWGRSWDTGNVTLTVEAMKAQGVPASKRPDLYTVNFEPYGLDDTSPLGYSNPAVVTTGAPATAPGFGGAPLSTSARSGTRYCSNCFAVPHGAGWNFGDRAPGATISWTALQQNRFVVGQRNEQNQVGPYTYASLSPGIEKSAFALTADQELTNDLFGLGPVSAAVTGFWSNRRGIVHYPGTVGSGNSREQISLDRGGQGFTVPTTNPYYPAGAPANLLVHYNFMPELGGARINGGEVARRAELALNFEDLPFGWIGDLSYSFTDDQNYAHSSNMLSINHARAALGNTIAAFPATDRSQGGQPYVKPSAIPFLNVFCDPGVYRCNAPETLRYITGYRNQDETWKIRQWGANISGPLFDLPAGELQGALSFEHTGQHYTFRDADNLASTNEPIGTIAEGIEIGKRTAHAFFGQLNIPLVGGDFSAPGVQRIDVELGYRLDHFDFQDGYVKTPKVAANWTVLDGFVLRGAWGKSFRAPAFGQTAEVSGSRVIALNENAPTQPYVFNCAVRTPGSLAADICGTSTGTAVAFQGLTIEGGSGLADPIRGIALRPNVLKGLRPESAKQYLFGVNITPPADGALGFLNGLALDVSYFNIKVDDTIISNNAGAGNPNLAISRNQYLAIPNPNAPITDPSNAAFLGVINELSQFLRAEFNSSFIPGIKFIRDAANTNIGSIELSGFDFDGRYDWDMGNFGSFHVGAAGYYEMDQINWSGEEGVEPLSIYDDVNSDTPRGQGGRLKRVRYRAGWTDGSWSTTLFANYKGHTGPSYGANLALPDCYWRASAGPGGCYPGSPYYPQAAGSPEVFYDGAPAHVEFDLNVTYNTGEMGASEIWNNVNFSLSIQNLLDRKPPFQYTSRSRGRETRAYDTRWSEFQRFVTLTVTKNW
jgi:outer membrane receptor protein involved in Fe transport